MIVQSGGGGVSSGAVVDLTAAVAAVASVAANDASAKADAAREYACSYARDRRDEAITHADAQALAVQTQTAATLAGALATLRAELASSITAALATAATDAQTRADAARTYADGLRAQSQVPMIFAAVAVAGGTSRSLYPGTAAPTANDVRVHVSELREVRALSIRARVGPGGTRTDTVTLRRGVAGGVLVDVGSVSLTGTATRALVPLAGVAFGAGDDLAVRLTTATGTTLADVVVEVLVW